MNQLTICTAAGSEPLRWAGALLQARFRLTAVPGPDTTHLLLPVPAFSADGRVKGGANTADLLSQVPADCVIAGGALRSPLLEGRRCVDLLQEPSFLMENAAITAHCAMKLAAARLPVIWKDLPVLIIGWGRIGLHLGRLLKAAGSRVTLAIRRPENQAAAASLGYEVIPPEDLGPHLHRFRVIFNTAPAPVLDLKALAFCRDDCLKIELASRPGLEGSDIIDGRGLPGRLAPETSGQLIAATILHLQREGRL